VVDLGFGHYLIWALILSLGNIHGLRMHGTSRTRFQPPGIIESASSYESRWTCRSAWSILCNIITALRLQPMGLMHPPIWLSEHPLVAKSFGAIRRFVPPDAQPLPYFLTWSYSWFVTIIQRTLMHSQRIRSYHGVGLSSHFWHRTRLRHKTR
jgi:hypothetical protein